MKSYFLVLVLCIFSLCSAGQVLIPAVVKDADTKMPIAFCSVAIKGSHKGGITNADGVLHIKADPERDTLIFSFLGYYIQGIAAKDLLEDGLVLLQKKSFDLQELVVNADNDYLYDILNKCRKQIRGYENDTAKVYFQVETDKQGQAVELLQGYYNAYFNGLAIDKLMLKNGRLGLAPARDSGYFLSLNTSKAISYIDLKENNIDFPAIPTQFNRNKIKKLFKLERIFDVGKELYHIEFSPNNAHAKSFSGEVWIEQETFALRKIKLTAKETNAHPFIPIFPGDVIDEVSFNITQTYSSYPNQLSNIDFQYELKYTSASDSIRLHGGSNSSYTINTKGLIYAYDYGNPFKLPYFDYDSDHNDYRKIYFIPYSEFFWSGAKAEGLVFTKEQMKKMDYFRKNGFLYNHITRGNQIDSVYLQYATGTGNKYNDQHLFGLENVFWSEKKRLNIAHYWLSNDSTYIKRVYQPAKVELYNLEVQLFLDVNQFGDSIQHASYTVFDVYQSYFYLPESKLYNCVINIYFDICEIERRKMEDAIAFTPNAYKIMDSIHKKATLAMEARCKEYLKDVQLGKNLDALFKWNDYVKEILDIDNVERYGITSVDIEKNNK